MMIGKTRRTTPGAAPATTPPTRPDHTPLRPRPHRSPAGAPPPPPDPLPQQTAPAASQRPAPRRPRVQQGPTASGRRPSGCRRTPRAPCCCWRSQRARPHAPCGSTRGRPAIVDCGGWSECAGRIQESSNDHAMWWGFESMTATSRTMQASVCRRALRPVSVGCARDSDSWSSCWRGFGGWVLITHTD